MPPHCTPSSLPPPRNRCCGDPRPSGTATRSSRLQGFCCTTETLHCRQCLRCNRIRSSLRVVRIGILLATPVARPMPRPLIRPLPWPPPPTPASTCHPLCHTTTPRNPTPPTRTAPPRTTPRRSTSRSSTRRSSSRTDPTRRCCQPQ